ncbi:hypothetical protein FRC03_005497 [Tulasnella sp. 419]|nr:hypothetical protein FRC03_005497 [Tulasnella sp. 419]
MSLYGGFRNVFKLNTPMIAPRQIPGAQAIRRYLFGRTLVSAAHPATLIGNQVRASVIDLSNSGKLTLAGVKEDEFVLYPAFFTLKEQISLLDHGLRKLDSVLGLPREVKKRRKVLPPLKPESAQSVSDLFLPDDCYQFEEGHFDGVIHGYRECHVSNWPEEVHPLLDRIIALMPGGQFSHESSIKPAIQSHLLHLSTDGEILPHVDNVEASGRVIVGVSLGSTRILRLQKASTQTEQPNPPEWIDILLESGSVYVQRDTVRYQFQHSIPRASAIPFRGQALPDGQRLSIMIRVC